MANNRRVSKVSSLMKREISMMLLQDIKDDRVGAGMVSITAVEVSGDLQHAKVFVSIYGSFQLWWCLCKKPLHSSTTMSLCFWRMMFRARVIIN